MHEKNADDPIESALHDAFGDSGASASQLPERVRGAVRVRRAQRRRRQLGGASTLIVVVASAAVLWTTQMNTPVGSPAARAPNEGPIIVRVGGCGDATMIGLMRCNRRYVELGQGEIILSEDWDLGWVGSAPALEPGDM